jgi:hypothetical protein
LLRGELKSTSLIVFVEAATAGICDKAIVYRTKIIAPNSMILLLICSDDHQFNYHHRLKRVLNKSSESDL